MKLKNILKVLFFVFTFTAAYQFAAAGGPPPGTENPLHQGTDKPLQFYKQTVYTSHDGLPQNSVYAITQTPDGYIWLATNAGVARFDGVTFDVFGNENSPIPLNYIAEFLLVDHNGALWIGTQKNGVVRYQNGIFDKSYTTRNGLVDNDVLAIQETLAPSGSSILWIGTIKGLNRIENGTVTTIPFPETAPSRHIMSLAEDSAGQLWIGALNGLLKLPTQHKDAVMQQVGFPGDIVSALAIDRDDRLWIAIENRGVMLVQAGLDAQRSAPREITAYTTQNGLGGDVISSLYLDPDGILWAGTRTSGLIQIKNDRVSNFDTSSGLSRNYVLSVFKDREGTMWIGTNGGGLNHLSNAKITPYNTRNGLSHDQVYGICQDSRGDIWVGTFGHGVNRIRNGRVVQLITTEDGLPDNSVVSICEDSDGGMWFGTHGGGVAHMKNGRIETYTTDDGLINNYIYGVYRDGRNRLWVGTHLGGLHRFQNNRFTLYKKLEGKVRTFLEDSRGDLWVGTDIHGLIRIKGGDGDIQRFTSRQGLGYRDILAVHEDTNGTIWVATYGGGLNRFKDGRFQVIRQSDGLPHDIIHWILEDDDRSLWLNTMNGIFRVSLKVLDDFLNGTSPTITGTLFGEVDGMKVREGNGGSHPSGLRSGDDRLWFITAAGVAVVDPSLTAAGSLPPPTAIKQVIIDGEPYKPGPQLTAPPGKRNFEIHYTALSFVVPKRVRFKYRLHGYDKTWQDPGTRRAAYYTNIPHGAYRFQVIACNHEGVWNETGSSFKMTVKAHFWQTWWFRTLVLLAAILLIRLFYFLKMRNVTLRQRLLEQQVAERTQTLEAKTVELQKKNAATEKINKIVKAINSKVDPKDILATILSETAILEGFNQAGALVYDRAEDAYVFKASLGYDMEDIGHLHFSLQEAEDRYVNGADEIDNDIFYIPDVKGRSGEDKIRTAGISKSLLVIKIRSGDDESEPGAVAGYLLFDSTKDVGDFSTRDIEVVRELKDHITAAFIKSKLLLELDAQREAAETANYSKSMFLARMSHEIRTPMNSVIGFTDMLMNTQLDAEQKDFLQNITKSGEALLYLIDEILDFSKVEAGQLTLEWTPFDLKAVALDVCGVIKPRVNEASVAIVCRFDPLIPTLVSGDPERIRQVLLNLMGNAAKFTETGTIELIMDVEQDDEEEFKLHVKVRDTGIGIAEDQLENVFQVFQQADGSITRKFGGTGLGLAISKQIAILLGGDIEVESRLGKGSTFHFTAWLEKVGAADLPGTADLSGTADLKGTAPAPKTGEAELPPANGVPPYILLAEDNPINRKLARFILTKGGCRLEEVTNGKEAVEAYTADPRRYDLILMDINMPELDGLAATQKIRAYETQHSHRIPIIALTAHAMKEDREKCMAADMDDYITKPIKSETIFEIIRKWAPHSGAL